MRIGNSFLAKAALAFAATGIIFGPSSPAANAQSGQLPELEVTNTLISTGPFTPGSTVEYRIRVTNVGPLRASIWRMDALVPQGLSLIELSPSNWVTPTEVDCSIDNQRTTPNTSITLPTVTGLWGTWESPFGCVINNLPPQGSADIKLTATIVATSDVVSNVVSVRPAFNPPDPRPGPTCAEVAASPTKRDGCAEFIASAVPVVPVVAAPPTVTTVAAPSTTVVAPSTTAQSTTAPTTTAPTTTAQASTTSSTVPTTVLPTFGDIEIVESDEVDGGPAQVGDAEIAFTGSNGTTTALIALMAISVGALLLTVARLRRAP
jgi:hypothetical protein